MRKVDPFLNTMQKVQGCQKSILTFRNDFLNLPQLSVTFRGGVESSKHTNFPTFLPLYKGGKQESSRGRLEGMVSPK